MLDFCYPTRNLPKVAHFLNNHCIFRSMLISAPSSLFKVPLFLPIKLLSFIVNRLPILRTTISDRFGWFKLFINVGSFYQLSVDCYLDLILLENKLLLRFGSIWILMNNKFKTIWKKCQHIDKKRIHEKKLSKRNRNWKRTDETFFLDFILFFSFLFCFPLSFFSLGEQAI